jgi:hypothetical protein
MMKNKIVREKLEEAYILLNELKFWLNIQYHRTAFDLKADLHDVFQEKFDGGFWSLVKLHNYDFDNIKSECPIERIVMLISLYAPSLKNRVHSYEMIVRLVNSLVITTYESKFLKTQSNIVEKLDDDAGKDLSEKFNQLHKPTVTAINIFLLECEKNIKVCNLLSKK